MHSIIAPHCISIIYIQLQPHRIYTCCRFLDNKYFGTPREWKEGCLIATTLTQVNFASMQLVR